MTPDKLNPEALGELVAKLSEAQRRAFSGAFSDQTSREMIELGLMTKIEGGSIHHTTPRGEQVVVALRKARGEQS